MPVEAFYDLTDLEQDVQIAAYETDQAKCPDCGRPRDECGDVGKKWYPQRDVCYARMEQAAADWRYGQLHEAEPFHNGKFTSWSKVRDADHPYHHRDGVTVFVAPMDLAPEDKFLAAPNYDDEGGVAE